MKQMKFFACAVLLFFPVYLSAQSNLDINVMNYFINSLMNKMTVEEKIGQLNLIGAGAFDKAISPESDIGIKLSKGEVGGVFTVRGVEKLTAIQKIAIERSRLKIPLLFGMDVIHG